MYFTTPNDIENWLSCLKLLRETKSCDGPRFVKPFHLATLAHTLRTLNVSHVRLPEKIAHYADTMKLWDALGIPSPFPPKNRQPGRYQPIELLTNVNSIDDLANRLVSLFHPVCPNERTIDAIQTMLRELIGNCYAHSDVGDGLYGIACAQVWNGGRKGQIALADSGVGVRASLQQNVELRERLQRENSCEMATEYGVTSKPGKGHSGYGLAVARGLLELNQGVLYVRSGHEAFCMSQSVAKKTNTETGWDGTLIVIEWDLDKLVDIGDVYSSFPLPEGMEDDDFFV